MESPSTADLAPTETFKDSTVDDIEVSDLGRVRRISTGQILTPCLRANGVCPVTLWDVGLDGRSMSRSWSGRPSTALWSPYRGLHT